MHSKSSYVLFVLVFLLIGYLYVGVVGEFNAFDGLDEEEEEEEICPSFSSVNSKIMRTRGDFVIGGIFPMHAQLVDRTDFYPCGLVKEEKGIQRLEAMLYAIDKINNDTEILSNVTLGVIINDSCSTELCALEPSMEFVRYYMNQVSAQIQIQTVRKLKVV